MGGLSAESSSKQQCTLGLAAWLCWLARKTQTQGLTRDLWLNKVSGGRC